MIGLTHFNQFFVEIMIDGKHGQGTHSTKMGNSNSILGFKQCGVSLQTLIIIVLVLIDKKYNYIYFFIFYSFGKRIGGAARRHNECLILEPSEMIVVSNKNILFFHLFFPFSPILFLFKAQLPPLVLSPYDFNLFLGSVNKKCKQYINFEYKLKSIGLWQNQSWHKISNGVLLKLHPQE